MSYQKEDAKCNNLKISHRKDKTNAEVKDEKPKIY